MNAIMKQCQLCSALITEQEYKENHGLCEDCALDLGTFILGGLASHDEVDFDVDFE